MLIDYFLRIWGSKIWIYLYISKRFWIPLTMYRYQSFFKNLIFLYLPHRLSSLIGSPQKQLQQVTFWGQKRVWTKNTWIAEVLWRKVFNQRNNQSFIFVLYVNHRCNFKLLRLKTDKDAKKSFGNFFGDPHGTYQI